MNVDHVLKIGILKEVINTFINLQKTYCFRFENVTAHSEEIFSKIALPIYLIDSATQFEDRVEKHSFRNKDGKEAVTYKKDIFINGIKYTVELLYTELQHGIADFTSATIKPAK